MLIYFPLTELGNIFRLHNYIHLIFNKCVKNIHWRNDSLFKIMEIIAVSKISQAQTITPYFLSYMEPRFKFVYMCVYVWGGKEILREE